MNQGRRSPNDIWVCHLGTIPYRDALAMQLDIAARRHGGELPDTLLLLEHPPVYTRGRRSQPGELTLGEEFYRARGIEVVPTDRGGRVTYHGPGQLVGYPIMGTTDVVAHLRTIEDAIVAALAEEGIAAHSRPHYGPNYTGVWVQEHKIASLGVHVSRGVSTHGFAVNIENDLEPFGWVVACGLPDVEMTSIAAELERDGGGAACPRTTFSCFRKRVAYHFCEAHGRRQRLVSPRRLGIDAPVAALSWRAPITLAHRPPAGVLA
ncbi:MAG TPA: lipoyl(octanoyl) transferase LipB [Solirubrobacteraceae bacterium]|jgi:lipoyl(octanoyl) transferase|nr:lipoyl(octanoyl) transferase LipB [Solirubrobacteraceae bacterium]